MSEEINESFEDQEEMTVVCSAREDAAKRILDYLKYNEINAELRDSEKDNFADIYVYDSDSEKAIRYISSFKNEEKKRAYKSADEKENDEVSEENTANIYSADNLESKEDVFEVTASAHSYQTNNEKYSASMSSAFAFMFVGSGLLIIIALVYIGVLNIPIKFDDNPMLAIILPVIAVAFEVVAVISWRHAQKYRAEIGTEEQFDKDLKEWFYNKYSAEDIDNLRKNDIQLGNPDTVNIIKHNTPDTEAAETTSDDDSEDTGIPAEILFLQRLEAIEKILTANYPDLDKGYVDVLSEEMYQKLFDDNRI